MCHPEMLDLIPDNIGTKFWNRHIDVRDTDTIKNISDHGEQHMGVEDKPITAHYI